MTQLAHDPTIQADGLTLADLKHVAPRSAKLNAAGHLEVAGVDLVELAQRVGTAIYVMDEAQIRSQLQEWQSALAKHWPNSMVAYAGKAFLCKAMCRLVDGEGAWLDVSSGGELAVALAAGFDPSRIIMHGNNKTDRELNEALDAGVGRIVVDSFEELNNLQCLARARDVQQQILLRIKPGVVADTHQHIATGGEDSKFGFGIADGWALKAIKLALLTPEATELCGLHFHIGSQIYALDSYEQAVEQIFGFIHMVFDECGYLPGELNLGGGLGVAYQAADRPTSIEQFVRTATQAVAKHGKQLGLDQDSLRLGIEPGRSIVANAGVTVYTVGAVKNLKDIRTYVAVDGGMSDNIRPVLYDAKYECLIADTAGQARSEVVTVVGKHCESGDVLAIDCSLQPARMGDTLVMLATGAYCQSMASNYNRQPRPAVIWLADGKAREVVRREGYADILSTDIG